MTRQQQKALHLWFTKVSQTLNDAGLDQRTVLKPGINIPWTLESFKKNIWKPTQKIMYGIESTTELDGKMINQLIDVFTQNFAERFGVEVDLFPSWEQLLVESSKQSN